MYAALFIHGNTGVRGDEQNLAAAAAVHMLENLLAANTAHGEKLVGLILSVPESQRSRGGPERPARAAPRAGRMGGLGVPRSWVQHRAPLPAPASPSECQRPTEPTLHPAELPWSGNAAL